jgi:cytoskeletal protein CcmA (bactofilin family)
MFRRTSDTQPLTELPATTDRVTSVIGPGVVWKGQLSGKGGVRIEGALDGDITLQGLLVVGETGRITCDQLRANVVIVAGAVRGDIVAEKLEIRSTGRVWGDVVTAAFSTEEGAFLRGQVTMEEQVEIEDSIAAETAEPEAPGGTESETAETEVE